MSDRDKRERERKKERRKEEDNSDFFPIQNLLQLLFGHIPFTEKFSLTMTSKSCTTNTR